MCKIICNVTYRCGHKEPWVSPRTCQIDLEGNRKWGDKDPMCLIPGHCWAFGSVRQINIVDELLCSACFIAQTKERKGLSANTQTCMISKATKDAKYHSSRAEKFITDAEKKSTGNMSAARIARVNDLALERIDFAFADEQMQPWHFAELLQIIADLPFLNKKKLARKFAKEAEKKSDDDDITWFYEVSMENRDLGHGFRQGLKNPSVLDQPLPE
ncbi:hypothetical protein F4678DRAFT_478166 [Xylaria arbuscula]|nr:hypothetical protein F4678DRAFT_478166 [Xylaria arbuscula]